MVVMNMAFRAEGVTEVLLVVVVNLGFGKIVRKASFKLQVRVLATAPPCEKKGIRVDALGGEPPRALLVAQVRLVGGAEAPFAHVHRDDAGPGPFPELLHDRAIPELRIPSVPSGTLD